MATGSEKRGTRRTGRGFRTPKLSDAQKRANRLDRAMNFGKSSRVTGGDVPF